MCTLARFLQQYCAKPCSLVQFAAPSISQHVAPNNVAICWVEMLRSLGQVLILTLTEDQSLQGLFDQGVIFSTTRINRPFLSCPPLYQNVSNRCETIHMKMCSACRFIFMQIKLEALIFFRLLLSNCLNRKIYCDDHSSHSVLLLLFEMWQ